MNAQTEVMAATCTGTTGLTGLSIIRLLRRAALPTSFRAGGARSRELTTTAPWPGRLAGQPAGLPGWHWPLDLCIWRIRTRPSRQDNPTRRDRRKRKLVMWPVAHNLSVGAVYADALFVSALQRSEVPDAGQVRRAVAEAIGAFGGPGCAERVAQEYGDHPETAAARMRWARTAARTVFADRAHGPGRLWLPLWGLNDMPERGKQDLEHLLRAGAPQVTRTQHARAVFDRERPEEPDHKGPSAVSLSFRAHVIASLSVELSSRRRHEHHRHRRQALSSTIRYIRFAPAPLMSQPGLGEMPARRWPPWR